MYFVDLKKLEELKLVRTDVSHSAQVVVGATALAVGAATFGALQGCVDAAKTGNKFMCIATHRTPTEDHIEQHRVPMGGNHSMTGQVVFAVSTGTAQFR